LRPQASIVHAVATPYRERSHFDGQTYSKAASPPLGPPTPAGSTGRCPALEPGGRVDPWHRKAFAVGRVTPLVCAPGTGAVVDAAAPANLRASDT